MKSLVRGISFVDGEIRVAEQSSKALVMQQLGRRCDLRSPAVGNRALSCIIIVLMALARCQQSRGKSGIDLGQLAPRSDVAGSLRLQLVLDLLRAVCAIVKRRCQCACLAVQAVVDEEP